MSKIASMLYPQSIHATWNYIQRVSTPSTPTCHDSHYGNKPNIILNQMQLFSSIIPFDNDKIIIITDNLILW